MTDPRAVVPESIMPGYPFLAKRELDYGDIAERLKVLQDRGRALYRRDDRRRQGRSRAPGRSRRRRRQGVPRALSEGAGAASSTATRAMSSELDALIAYLQMLGTLVDFATFDAAGPNLR